MSTTEVRGTVHGRTVHLDEDAPTFPDGTKVSVQPVPRYLTGAEIVARLRESPPVSKEDAQALMEAIEEGDRRRESGRRTVAAGELWAALRARMKGSAEDYDELERSIESAQQPMSDESPFADPDADNERL